MIERGSGRTSGLTDWRLMDVLSMWACLHDQDTTGQWKQVAGWRKVCDLALAHLGRLREYRRGLAEAWPPETNAAARAYVGELDQLIERVQHTHDAAAANYDALAAAARAIGSARTRLQPLHDEYATKLQQKRAYEAIVADPKAVAGSRLPERPPVTDDDLEQLNVRARGLMTGLSGELQQAQVMLQRPPAPVRPGRQVNDPDAYGQAPPVIPPIIPVAVSPPTGNHLSTKAAIATQEARPPTSAAGVTGPILGGAGATQAPITSTQPNNVISPSAPGFGAQSAITPVNGIAGRPPIRPDPLVPNPYPGEAPTSRPPQSKALRPTTPNGFIGTPSSPGINPPAPGTPRRVNPVGGVIGGGGAGTAPSGAAGSRPGTGRFAQPNGGQSAFPVGGSPTATPRVGQRKQHRDDPEVEATWDLDHPWQTSQGVTPVLLPPEEEGPIDPGPAIGFDR
ncbi:hypothetical protein O7602_24565 [Micromonospora sp. WMMD1128]|nr:hypothetical protein [Micromonospora sp. WMMD1128]WBB72842.1 hypothetical protein O7602_24565 [Micromonospora sp. WMMD1128]